MRLSRRRCRESWVVAAAVAGVAVGAVARAADTWDNSSGDAKWFTPANWADDTTPTSSDAVTFPLGQPGGASTIDLTGQTAADAGSLTFNDSYTFAGGSLRLGSSVNVASGATARMSGPMLVTGANGLGKSGGGTLVLTTPTAAGYYASVGAGTLRLEASVVNNVSIFGTLELGGINYTGSATLNNAGRLSATGTSTFSGVLTLNTSSKLTITTSGTLTLGNEVNDVTSPSSSANLRSYTGIEGAGVVTLAQPGNANTRWALNGGTLQVAGDDRLGISTNDFLFTGGTLIATETFSSGRPVFMYGPGGTFNVASGKTLTWTAPINGTTDAVLTKSGGGTLVLTGANATRGGETTVKDQGGRLRVENATALGTGKVNLSDIGVTLEIGGVTLANDINIPVSRNTIRGIGTAAATGTITMPSGASAVTLVTYNASDVLTLGNAAGDITGGGSSTSVSVGQVGVAPGGTVVIPYGNPAFTGSWSVTNQTLRIGDATSLGTGTSPVALPNGTLELSGITFARDVNLSGGILRGTGATARATGTVKLANSGVYLSTGVATDVLTIADSPNDLTGGGAFGSVNILGSGTVVLAQPSNYVGQWFASNGKLRLDAADALGAATNALTVSAGVQVNAPQHLATLTVSGSGQVNFGAGGGNTLVLGSLAGPTGTGKIDLRDNAMIVANTPAGSWGGSAYTGVSGLVAQGRSGGTWAGGGIITSDSRRAGDYASVGIARASEALGIASAATQAWHGQTVHGSDTLIGFTYGGDANLDGVINIDDYTQIDSSVSAGGALKGWFNGDFNYDGEVNIDDYTIIDSNIAVQGAPLTGAAPLVGFANAAVPAVPEPSALALVVGAGLFRSRRRRNARKSQV